MNRRLLLPAALAAVLLAAGGWIFRVQPAPPEPDYAAAFAGGAGVSVRFVPGCAADVAARIAADYRADGWEELPVSTAAFRLLARGRRVAAVLAEDLPAGVRVTELRSAADVPPDT